MSALRVLPDGRAFAVAQVSSDRGPLETTVTLAEARAGWGGAEEFARWAALVWEAENHDNARFTDLLLARLTAARTRPLDS